jgi:hypothetical protein
MVFLIERRIKMSTQIVPENVANYDHQWTGIAAMPDSQIFVNFPRWSADVPVSVARFALPNPLPKSVNQLMPSHHVIPFPNPAWNDWKRGVSVQDHFVCVQSVVADRKGYLWVLDSGNPEFKGVVPGAPKLLKFDPRNGRLLSRIPYAEPVILPESYLNDVRIDTTRGMAYLTDSETGAIIITDLRSGSSRRLLDDHPSVKAEALDEIVIDDTHWRPPGGGRVHSDGIALSPENTTLYFHALMGRTLYRVSTAALRDPALTLEELGNKVEKIGEETGCADGIECAPDDGTLYLTSLEDNAVRRLLPNGKTEIVVRDRHLEWPDSLAVAHDGYIYVTTSRIHLGRGPYSVFRFKP